MRLRSLRARLTLWYMSLLTVTVLILGGGAYGLLVYSLTHETDAALHGVATALAEQAQRQTTVFVPSDVDAIFQRFFGISPWERYFEMRDPFGRRVPRLSPPRTGQLPLSPQAVRNAAAGRPTMETVEGLGRYPVRVLTLPVYEAGRVARFARSGSLAPMPRMSCKPP